MLEVFQLNGVPCTMEQVEEVAHRPETRTGLLDFVGSDCHGRSLLPLRKLAHAIYTQIF